MFNLRWIYLDTLAIAILKGVYEPHVPLRGSYVKCRTSTKSAYMAVQVMDKLKSKKNWSALASPDGHISFDALMHA